MNVYMPQKGGLAVPTEAAQMLAINLTSNRVDTKLDLNALLLQTLGQLGNGVLRICYSQPITRYNQHTAG